MSVVYAVDLGRIGGDKTVRVEGIRYPDGKVVIFDVRELEPSCDAQGHHAKYCRMGECQYAEIGLPRCKRHAQGQEK